MKRILAAFVALTGLTSLRAQITINSLDMFYAPGQYYRSYAADGEVSVQGLLGGVGGPQNWNFSTGPQDAVFRFDYLDPEDAGAIASLFPEAKLVERKQVENGTVGDAWLFLDQQFGKGRMAYGFYDPAITGPVGLDDPAGIFDPPLLDFPEGITLGRSWSGGTVFLNSMLGAEMRMTYTSSATADAYGIVTLPKLGFMECIRVNELVSTLYEIKFPDAGEDLGTASTGGEFTPVAEYYVRNLYWMAKDRGIVVQITSRESATPPPDEFATAAQFVRMFETNHPKGSTDPWPVTDLSITLGESQVLLGWTKPLNATSFRVEHTGALGPDAVWTTLTTTTSNFALDDRVAEGARHYRVVSLP
ncbi:MAG: hypothetical protein H7A46_20410 [Verrucomicrobiales bacterium]|nr:hypothetical protein [Verrucomicrobiales bacterium]